MACKIKVAISLESNVNVESWLRYMEKTAKVFYINGIVQGVGFRPHVFKLAEELGIKGWVNNSSQGLTVHAEGENLDLFYKRLIEEAPPLARILTARGEAVEPKHYQTFTIAESEILGKRDVLISPDVATCQDCLKDMGDRESRFYRFPFTNCTNCGPRYTIVRDVPYDRAFTSMSRFPMCKACEADYCDPKNRRFHAQPVACEKCGPKLQLLDAQKHVLAGIGIQQLMQGGIIAVKGLGGFHLVCDARNAVAVQRLRQRKERGIKPFAVMARSVSEARTEVTVNSTEEKLLTSPAAPIVVLERKSRTTGFLPEEIAPGLHSLGVMLPYTPLHHLLFEGPFDFLVMTSANISGHPLIYKNDEALEMLKGLADYYLIHDRDIVHPCDDSVVRVIGEQEVFLRRARGYVPLPILMSAFRIKTPLLGVGGDLKNAFCLAKGQRAFVSQYLGDMEEYENYRRFRQELDLFQRVVNIEPESIAYDQHPNYQLTGFARGEKYPGRAVQHHHAHLVSVLGEWDRTEPTLGVICDGTGYGEDGCIWGFEFLYGNASGYERRGHLEYLGLPGGDAGVKHPLRIAYAYLKTLLSDEEWSRTHSLWSVLSDCEQKVLNRQIDTGVRIFQTSSAGRLFDAVSGLLGICTEVTYEGQAAIELESTGINFLKTAHDRELKISPYAYELRWENGVLILGVGPLFKELARDVLQGVKREEISYRFHISIARAIVCMAERLGVRNGPLALSGGVFQNKLLTEAVLYYCREKGIKVLRAKTLPPGDGGLAFGQLLIANEVL